MRGHLGPCERLGLETISGDLRANKRVDHQQGSRPPVGHNAPYLCWLKSLGSYRLGTQGTV